MSSKYEIIESNACFEIGKRDGVIHAVCVCGNGAMVVDKGLGRATIATWKTRHQFCESVDE